MHTAWLDVMGISAYPVFDVHKGAGGGDRRYTYPDEARGLPGYSRNRWTVPEDGVLVGTAGHLHPGGLWTDLKLTRDGRTVPLFRSVAEYFEPAGAVSWDVAMTATPADWRVGVRRGDVVSVSATYDTSRASWYESMGIMPLMYSPGGSGPDPLVVDVNRPGQVTHGRLRENRNHGGPFGGGLPDARRLLPGPLPARRTVAVQRVRLRPRRPRAGRAARAAADRPPGQPPEVRQPRRLERHLPHDHVVPRAVQRPHGDRVPARRRQGPLRLGQPRLRPGGAHPGGPADHVEDAEGAQAGHLQLLLPRAPVHAGRVPRGEAAVGRAGLFARRAVRD